jgi:hypothetical protein
MQGSDPIDEGATLAGEFDEEAASVGGVGDALHEPGAFEAGESVGHRARTAHQLAIELGGGEAERRPTASQAREDVEGFAGEPEVSEAGVDGGVGVCSSASEPGDHGGGSRVELGTGVGPLREHMVDVVSVGRGLRLTSFKFRHSIFRFRLLGECIDWRRNRKGGFMDVENAVTRVPIEGEDEPATMRSAR